MSLAINIVKSLKQTSQLTNNTCRSQMKRASLVHTSTNMFQNGIRNEMKIRYGHVFVVLYSIIRSFNFSLVIRLFVCLFVCSLFGLPLMCFVVFVVFARGEIPNVGASMFVLGIQLCLSKCLFKVFFLYICMYVALSFECF